MSLFLNARVIPDAASGGPRAEAVLVRGERIAAVGDAADLRERLHRNEEAIDLDGTVLLPGFTDSHIHTGLYARSLFSADLRGTPSLEETLQRVAGHLQQRVEAAKAEGSWPQQPRWIFGSGWDHNLWEAPAMPDRAALDSVTGNFPTALHSGDAHTWWVNSAGLDALGITRQTPDPDGGTIEVYDAGPWTGQPTGILREQAGRAVETVLASGASGNVAEQLAHAQRTLWAQGLVGVHDFDGEDCLGAYRQLHSSGRLGLRVTKSVPQTHLAQAVAEGRFTGAGDAWLRTGGVKIFADGALGSHTCLMHQPLEHAAGVEVTSSASLDELMLMAARSGIAVATHAIGDRANAQVLDAYARLARRAEVGEIPAGLRHRIEHAQHLSPPDVARFSGLGVAASMQPIHATADYQLAERLLGRNPAKSYAWRSLLDAGARLVLGSDAPVETPSPLAGIHAAVTRRRADGSPDGGWQPEQRITVAEALAGYTAAPAWAGGVEQLTGAVRPGMFADFTLLREDPFAVEPADLSRIPVAGVITGGVVRHWAPG